MIEVVWLTVENIKFGSPKTRFFSPPQTVNKQISPTQSYIVEFDKQNVLKILENDDKNDFLCINMRDSEGKFYSKRVGRIKRLKNGINYSIKRHEELNNKAKNYNN